MNAGLEQLRAIGNRLLNDLSRLSKSDLNIVTMIGLIAVVAILLPVVFTVIGVLTVASAACHPERERSQTRTQESPPEPNHHEDHTITPERMDHA